MKLIAAIFAFAATLAAYPPSTDSKKVDAEALRYFQALIRLDTSNPPGNETTAAEYLKGILEREGIPVKLFGPTPTRQSLVARLKGNGSKKPILIMGHTDVVPVQKGRWTEDPFGATIKDGFVWGRGTLDDKPNVIASLMTMLLLKRSGATLDRDVIFVAEADEEVGGVSGIQYLIKNHWPEIEAEFCLTEGGKFSAVSQKVRFQSVQTAEKMPRGMKLVVSGTAGHGSQPRPDNAIVRLSAAVAKIGTWQPPMRLNDITRAYLERLAVISSPEEAARLNGLMNPAKTAAIQEYYRQNNIYINSILRTSISPNMLTGGVKINVIPSEAEAILDVRALPDENMDKFKEEMAKVIGDPTVRIVPEGVQSAPSPASSLDTQLFRTLDAVHKQMFPGTPILPSMSTGATDMRYLRAKGVQSYGIGPVVDEEDATGHAMHSDNERIRETSLYSFVKYVHEIVSRMAVSH